MGDKLNVTVSTMRSNQGATLVTHLGTTPDGTVVYKDVQDNRLNTETITAGITTIVVKEGQLATFNGEPITSEKIAEATKIARDVHKALGVYNTSFAHVDDPSGTKNPGSTQSTAPKTNPRAP